MSMKTGVFSFVLETCIISLALPGASVLNETIHIWVKFSYPVQEPVEEDSFKHFAYYWGEAEWTEFFELSGFGMETMLAAVHASGITPCVIC